MPEQKTSRFNKPQLVVVVVLVLLQTLGVAVFAYARLGNPRNMPDQLFRLAVMVRNPAVRPEIPVAWVQLCVAWDSWLGVLQREAPRLLQTEELWQPNDPLRAEIAGFLANANAFRPETLIPEAVAEKNLRVLAESPPEAVKNELQIQSALARVHDAGRRITMLRVKLETWPNWKELHSLLKLMQHRGFTRTATALQPRLPRERRDGHQVNTVRTLKLLNDISADDAGMLRLASRWREFSRLSAALEASKNQDEQALPSKLLAGLTDQPTLAAFADSLVDLIEEMRRLRPVLAVAPVPPAPVPPTPLERKRATVVRPLVPVVKP